MHGPWSDRAAVGERFASLTLGRSATPKFLNGHSAWGRLSHYEMTIITFLYWGGDAFMVQGYFGHQCDYLKKGTV